MPHGSLSGDSLGLSTADASVGRASQQESCCRWCDLIANSAAKTFATLFATVFSLVGAMLFVLRPLLRFALRVARFFTFSDQVPAVAAGAASRVSACSVGVATEALESRQLLSATYFVAPSGSDTNPGTIGAPFRTIQRAANVAGTGSTVDIRGGVYRETVTPRSSGVTFQAYNNENVEIDGADPLTGLTKVSGSIYEARNAGDLGFGNNQVYANGQALTEASYPSTGLNLSRPTLASVQSGGYGLTSSAVGQSAINWTGGVVHIISGQGWVSQTATITGQSGNHVYFGLSGTVDPHGGVTAGDKFYLTGKLAALRSPGQFYVGNGGTYFIPPSGAGTGNVEQKHRFWGFVLSGKSNITIKGVNLFACSILGNGSSNINITNIHAKYVSQFITLANGWQPANTTGIVLNGNNNSVTNSVIAYSAGDGILLLGQHNTARNNVVHDCDYSATDTAGIRTWGGGDVIDHNTVYNCGRDGIKFAMTTNTQVTANLVHDVMLQTSDGGAIYTFGTNGAGSTIAYNKHLQRPLRRLGRGGAVPGQRVAQLQRPQQQRHQRGHRAEDEPDQLQREHRGQHAARQHAERRQLRQPQHERLAVHPQRLQQHADDRRVGEVERQRLQRRHLRRRLRRGQHQRLRGRGRTRRDNLSDAAAGGTRTSQSGPPAAVLF